MLITIPTVSRLDDVHRRLAVAALMVSTSAAAVEVVVAEHGRSHAGWGWVAFCIVVIAGGLISRTSLALVVVPAAFTVGLMISDVWLGIRHSRPIGWDLFDHDSLSHTGLWLGIMFFGVSQIAAVAVLMERSLRQLLDPDGYRLSSCGSNGEDPFDGQTERSRAPVTSAEDWQRNELPSVNDDTINDMYRHKEELEAYIQELKAQRDALIIRRALGEIGLCSVAATLFGAGMIVGILIYVWWNTL